MKLCLNTHNLVGKMNLDEIIEICLRHGIPGIEFSIGYNHKHGVELDTSLEERRQIRDKITQAGLETVCISSFSRFDQNSEDDYQKNIRNAKAGMELARDLQCQNFRFVGNDLPDFLDRRDFALRIANVLKELAQYGKELNVRALFNMHGTFQYRKDILEVMANAGTDNCGLVYNCDLGDLNGGSCEVTVDLLKDYIAHVHMHCFLNGYPYDELFTLLKEAKYSRWYSIVVDEPSSDTDRLIGYFSKLARSLYNKG